jgi:hypothetical protein
VGAAAALGDVDSIRRRMDIRRAVLKGDVEDALERVVDLDLEVRFFSFFLEGLEVEGGFEREKGKPNRG